MSKMFHPHLGRVSFFSLIVCLLIIFAGCSSKVNSNSIITKDFSKDTSTVIELYSKRIKDGVQLTDQQARQIDYYYNNYSSKKPSSEKEKEIMMDMATLKVSADMYESAYKKQNRTDMSNYLKGFDEIKSKIEDNLK